MRLNKVNTNTAKITANTGTLRVGLNIIHGPFNHYKRGFKQLIPVMFCDESKAKCLLNYKKIATL